MDRLQHFQPKEPFSGSETHFGVNKQNDLSHVVLVRCIRTLERETETNSTRGNNPMAKAAKKAPAKKAAKKAPAKKKASKKR